MFAKRYWNLFLSTSLFAFKKKRKSQINEIKFRHIIFHYNFLRRGLQLCLDVFFPLFFISSTSFNAQKERQKLQVTENMKWNSWTCHYSITIKVTSYLSLFTLFSRTKDSRLMPHEEWTKILLDEIICRSFKFEWEKMETKAKRKHIYIILKSSNEQDLARKAYVNHFDQAFLCWIDDNDPWVEISLKRCRVKTLNVKIACA
jgi:hypothetical protein